MQRALPWKALRGAAAGAGLLLALGASTAAAGENSYIQTNLVSDQAGHAILQDPNLVNAWGLSASPTSPMWVANNVTATSTLYTGFNPALPVNKVGLTVAIPDGGPTGTVFNSAAGSGAFPVTDGTVTAPAIFLFVSDSGAVTGWNPTVGVVAGSSPPSTQAQLVMHPEGAGYFGMTLANTKQGPRAYAANFIQGRIDVWDGAWNLVSTDETFTDPMLPEDYHPFNVQAIGNRIYVAYAQFDEEEQEEVA